MTGRAAGDDNAASGRIHFEKIPRAETSAGFWHGMKMVR